MNVIGDQIEPFHIGRVSVRGTMWRGRWRAFAFAPGTADLIARADGATPALAVLALLDGLRELRDAIDEALSDPATVRMDTPDMMPEEP